MDKLTVLVVEDEAIVAQDLAEMLQQLGYTVVGIAATDEEAIALAAQTRPDLVLMDIRLQGSSMDGITAAETIRKRYDVPVIYVTAHSDEATLKRARVSGPFGYILKPFEERDLATQIELALFKHRTDREVREQREWLRVTLKSIGDAVITTDTSGRVSFMNPMAEKLTGWTGEEAMGQPLASVFRVIDEQTGEPQEEHVGRVLRESLPEPIDKAAALMCKDGRIVPIQESAAPIWDAEGRLLGAVIVFHDVTEKRRAEEALRESEKKYRSLFENTLHEVHLWKLVRDEDGTIKTWRLVDINPAALKAWGKTRSETVGKTCDQIHPDPKATSHFMPIVQKIFAEGKPHTWEAYFAGTSQYLHMTSVPFDDHFISTGTDISERKRLEQQLQDAQLRLEARVRERTAELFAANEALVAEIAERKQIEEALRKSEELFRELAENIREFFWVRTPDEILYVSPAYEDIWGRSRESLYESPESFLDLVHPDDRERVLEAHQADITGMTPLDEQYRIIRPDGAVRWIWARSFPIRGQGRVVRIVGIAEDISARKEAENFLLIERDLALRLGSAAGLSEALKRLLEACLKIDDLDCGGIYMLNPETTEIELLCEHGLSETFLERVSRFDLSSPQGRFAMEGMSAYWSEPIGIFEMGDVFKAEGLRALASIPVKADGMLVAFLNVGSHTHAGISDSTRSSLESIASRIGEVISRVKLGETIKTQGERLQETNVALKVLLRQREKDRADLEESFVSNVKYLIFPFLDKLRNTHLSGSQKQLLEILESHLDEITSPFVRKVSSSMIGLTPTEIRVAELIRQGKSTKEIVDLLVTSKRAVIFHRQGIRRKLGLAGKKINLRTYLAGLS